MDAVLLWNRLHDNAAISLVEFSHEWAPHAKRSPLLVCVATGEGVRLPPPSGKRAWCGQIGTASIALWLPRLPELLHEHVDQNPDDGGNCDREGYRTGEHVGGPIDRDRGAYTITFLQSGCEAQSVSDDVIYCAAKL